MHTVVLTRENPCNPTGRRFKFVVFNEHQSIVDQSAAGRAYRLSMIWVWACVKFMGKPLNIEVR